MHRAEGAFVWCVSRVIKFLLFPRLGAALLPRSARPSMFHGETQAGAFVRARRYPREMVLIAWKRFAESREWVLDLGPMDTERTKSHAA